MNKKKDRYEFIWDAIQKHGYKYDYRKVDYINSQIKVCIICKEHGEFWQRPNGHLNSKGCPKCANKEKINTEEFTKRAKLVHGYKFNYSKVNYVNTKTKVCIICPEHGEFWQTPNSHLQGKGCSICYGNVKFTTEEFIKRANLVHRDKYDYSKVKYINIYTKVCIICQIHGEFWQNPDNHLQGSNCPLCYRKSSFLNNNDFIKKTVQRHGDKYDYSKVEYIDYHTKVCIICPIHGEFWQTPESHMHLQGCPVCKESKLEKKIRVFLEQNRIKHECQKRFKWLGMQSLDFYLIEYNIAIECQGIQHFKPKSFGSKKENAGVIAYQDCVERDKRKLNLCTDNSVKLIYINYFDSEEEINNKLTFCHE